MGFMCLSLLQFAAVFVTTIINLPDVAFLVGSCWLFIAIAKDITNDLAGLSFNRRSNNTRHRLAREHFCDIVQVYAELKQLSGN